MVGLGQFRGIGGAFSLGPSISRHVDHPEEDEKRVTYQRPEADRHNAHEEYLRAWITEALAATLFARETLDKQEILRVTGVSRATRLKTLPVPTGRDGRAAGMPPVSTRPGAAPV
jgi:hypothetical protein